MYHLHVEHPNEEHAFLYDPSVPFTVFARHVPYRIKREILCIRARVIGGVGDGIRVIFRYAFRFYKLVKRIVGICLLRAVASTVHAVVRIFFHIAHIVEGVLYVLVLCSICVRSIYMLEPPHVFIIRVVRLDSVSVFDVHPLSVFVIADIRYVGIGSSVSLTRYAAHLSARIVAVGDDFPVRVRDALHSPEVVAYILHHGGFFALIRGYVPLECSCLLRYFSELSVFVARFTRFVSYRDDFTRCVCFCVTLADRYSVFVFDVPAFGVFDFYHTVKAVVAVIDPAPALPHHFIVFIQKMQLIVGVAFRPSVLCRKLRFPPEHIVHNGDRVSSCIVSCNHLPHCVVFIGCACSYIEIAFFIVSFAFYFDDIPSCIGILHADVPLRVCRLRVRKPFVRYTVAYFLYALSRPAVFVITPPGSTVRITLSSASYAFLSGRRVMCQPAFRTSVTLIPAAAPARGGNAPRCSNPA